MRAGGACPCRCASPCRRHVVHRQRAGRTVCRSPDTWPASAWRPPSAERSPRQPRRPASAGGTWGRRTRASTRRNEMAPSPGSPSAQPSARPRRAPVPTVRRPTPGRHERPWNNPELSWNNPELSGTMTFRSHSC
jgi:hypothetical protein